MLVGRMPNVVNEYVQSNSLSKLIENICAEDVCIKKYSKKE